MILKDAIIDLMNQVQTKLPSGWILDVGVPKEGVRSPIEQYWQEMKVIRSLQTTSEIIDAIQKDRNPQGPEIVDFYS